LLPTKFQLIWLNGFREDFLKLANHKQELPMAAHGNFAQAKQFQEQISLKIDQPETRMATL
jgi:hypothetical protein